MSSTSLEIAAEYCCPGETQVISPAVHLGRLARNYAGCTDCPRRHDTGSLSPRQTKQLRQQASRRAGELTFDCEEVRGSYPEHLGARQARQLAAALAATLRQDTAATADHPFRILIASDGSASSAAVHAGIVEGLRFANCDVIDIGLATVPMLAMAIAEQNFDGGVLTNRVADPTPQVVLRMLGPGGCPFSVGDESTGPDGDESIGGSLAKVQYQFQAGIDRGCRTAGRLRRDQVTVAYLDHLRPFFHALRPLRFAMLSSSRVIQQHVAELISGVGCQNVTPVVASMGGTVRADNLSEQVVTRRADFGIWIDPFGEACQVVDERGQCVAPGALLAQFAHGIDASDLGGDLPPVTSEHTYRRLRSSSVDAHVAAGGRYWFTNRVEDDAVPAVEGLQVLARLLTLLSRSDTPLSDVLAA